MKEATASLDGLEDCLPEPPPENRDCIDDVVLYLVLDNSTSMLQPDPSTTAASRSDRLEAQDRVALYAYQQAIGKAGYGFSRIGSDDVLSTTEFRDAVINNSSSSLAETLSDFEVVLQPDVSADEAQKVTVHLITYGYAVDYDKTSFGPNNPQKGMDVAETILDVQTPDQIYGNSIDGNSLWQRRDLPDPTKNDLFQGTGRPSSNLYSGTEMLGALVGLEHLLSQQLASGDANGFTYVAMTTDGRPERRAWWDTREGPGSDSITGEAVPLPKKLGGDPITTSGLIYNQSGDAFFLEDNNGDRPWPVMQRELNAALDAVAAQATCDDGLEVDVVAMGDDTDADFPAIYSDLFKEKTFDPSSGGWSYQVQTSYGLPEFGG